MAQIYGGRPIPPVPLFVSALFFLVFLRSNAQSFIPCEPVGGRWELEHFFTQELVFPEQALERNIQGNVWLIFAVLRDGSVKDLRVWRGLEPACDAEALRLGRLVRWLPAEMGGVAVDSEHFLVVPFKPRTYRKWLKRRLEPDPETASLPVATCGTVHSSSSVSSLPAPVIPNGMNGLAGWWSREMRYPVDAQRRNIQGMVKMRFIVEPDGSVTHLHAVQDLGGGCTQEACRMIRSLRWIPGMRREQRVRTQMELDVHFRLPEP